MTQEFINKLQTDLQELFVEIPEIDKNSSVSTIRTLENNLAGFTEFIQTSLSQKQQQKQVKKIILCEENGTLFANLIRFLLFIEYKNIQNQTFKLISALSFPKSTIPGYLCQNGSFQLISFCIDMAQPEQKLILLQHLNTLFEHHSSVVNLQIIEAVGCQLSSLNDNVRHLIYDLFQMLLIKNTQYFEEIYEILIEQSVNVELYDDIVYVVNLLSYIYQDPKYKKQVLENNSLSRIFNIFVERQEVIEQVVIESKIEVFKEKSVVIQNKIINATKQIEMLEYLLQDDSQHICDIKKLIQEQQEGYKILQEKYEQQKVIVLQKQKEFNDAIKKNPNNYEQLQKELQADYNMNEFQCCETALNSSTQALDNLGKKLERYKLKIQNENMKKEQILGQKTQFYKELEQIKSNNKNQEDGQKNEQQTSNSDEHVKKLDNQHKQLDYHISAGYQFGQKLEYVKDFISCAATSVECISYLCDHKHGLNYLFLQISGSNMCSEVFAFYDLICNLIFCNNGGRNEIYNLLLSKQKQFQSDALRVQEWKGTATFTLMSTKGIKWDDKEETNDIIRLIVMEGEKTMKMKSEIVTSFHGSGSGLNLTFNYLAFVLIKYLKCGLLEFLLIQYCQAQNAAQEQHKKVVLILIAEIYLRIQKLIPNLESVLCHQYINNIFIGNKLLDNQQIYQKLKCIWSQCSSSAQCSFQERFNLELQNALQQVLTWNNELSPNQKINKVGLTNLNLIKQYWNESNVNDCNFAIRWNWEKINDVIQLMYQLPDVNIKILNNCNKIIKFLDGTLMQQKSQQCKCEKSNFVGVSNTTQEFNLMFKEPNKCMNIFKALVCDETKRIIQICFQFLQLIIGTNDGYQLIKDSKIIQMFKNIMQDTISDNFSASAFCFISLFTFYEETFNLLQEGEVIGALHPLIYDEKYQHITKIFTSSSALSSQSIYTGIRKCECGNTCYVSNKFNDQIRILIISAISATDATTRYAIALHFGMLLKSRQYMLKRYNVQSKCQCLCRGCFPNQQLLLFKELLNKESEQSVIQCLAPLINDIQPEVAILALLILEEFIPNAQHDIGKNLNLSNWKNYGKFMVARFLQQEKYAQKYINQLNIDAKQLFDTISIYQWQHNVEIREFLSMNRYISNKVRDVMYEKVCANEEDKSTDIYYRKLQEFAFDSIIMPHLSTFGRGILGINEKVLNDQEIGKWFRSDRVLQQALLPQTLTNTQTYVRTPQFLALKDTTAGINIIVQNNILDILEQKIMQFSERMRISYRGVLYTFASLMTKDLLYNSVKNRNIYKVYHQLAISCDVSHTKKAALECIAIMSENSQLKIYYQELGWVFYTIYSRNRNGICCMLQNIDLIKQQHTFVEYSEEQMTKLLGGQKCIDEITNEKDIFAITKYLPESLRENPPDVNVVSDIQNFFKQLQNEVDPKVLPDLYVYQQLHRAVIGFNEPKGVLCLKTDDFIDYIKHYVYSQEPQITENVYIEKARNYQDILKHISEIIPSKALEFNAFKYRDSYKDLDLTIYDAAMQIISADQFDRQDGLKILIQLKKQQVHASPLLSLYLFYILGNNHLGEEMRRIVDSIISYGIELVPVFDSLKQCINSVDKNRFM